ncbi:hypothetical protein ACN4EG_26600 [Alkalinema pantanalense CENA528]|uniref:hypothetical protein n=1 Tax=Alkalinema pantanalense TaxID=1620705 RepID=UPI003D70104D
MPKVLNPNESYTFSKYFDLPYAPEDILADLGCTLERTDRETLPYTQIELDWLPALAESMRRRLRRVNTTTEQARREALIFPLIDQICDRLNYPINIEYSLTVSNWLKGSLDYYIPSPSHLLIIEAKQSDLTKGFTQLAVELIALDRWIESENPILYGAVSTGEIWRFGQYDRSAHHVIEYLPLHPVPQELELVTRTLIGILQGETPIVLG